MINAKSALVFLIFAFAKINKFKTLLIIGLALISLSACDSPNKLNKSGPSTENQTIPETSTKVDKQLSPENEQLSAFILQAELAFKQLKQSSQALNSEVLDFIKTPSEKTIELARHALKKCHDDYLLTSIFRSSIAQAGVHHPTLDASALSIQEANSEVVHTNHIRLDQHPIIEGYLDAVAGYPASGLIYSEQNLSKSFLNTEHQFTDTAYVAMGFHALDFMLNGNQESLPRQISDFETPDSLEIIEDSETPDRSSPTKRRSQYIQLLALLIAEDVDQLSEAWLGADSFYQSALANKHRRSIEKLLKDSTEGEQTKLIKLEKNLTKGSKEMQHSSANSLELRKQQLRALIALL